MNGKNCEIVRTHQAAKLLGVDRSTLYRWGERDKTFPRRVKLGPATSGYRRAELESWIELHKTA